MWLSSTVPFCHTRSAAAPEIANQRPEVRMGQAPGAQLGCQPASALVIYAHQQCLVGEAGVDVHASGAAQSILPTPTATMDSAFQPAHPRLEWARSSKPQLTGLGEAPRGAWPCAVQGAQPPHCGVLLADCRRTRRAGAPSARRAGHGPRQGAHAMPALPLPRPSPGAGLDAPRLAS